MIRFEPNPDPKNGSVGPKKAQNDPKIGQKLKSGIKTFLRKKKLLVYMHNHQNGIEPYLNSKIADMAQKSSK